MQILKFELGPIPTNTYLVYNEELMEAIIVDAPPGTHMTLAPILKKKKLKLSALLLTHGHWDHLADAQTLQQAGAKVYIHKDDLWWLEDPMIMGFSMPPGLFIAGTHADFLVEEGQTISLLGLTLEIRHIPGHAPGSVLYYSQSLQVAFVGDAIFARSIGRYDLPGGDFRVLENSIQQKIYTLPENTILYSGHGVATTVKEEKAHNPYVKPL